MEAIWYCRKRGPRHLQVPEDATSKELIRRWEYSPEEMTANINAPKESPKIWEKLWFDL